MEDGWRGYGESGAYDGETKTYTSLPVETAMDDRLYIVTALLVFTAVAFFVVTRSAVIYNIDIPQFTHGSIDSASWTFQTTSMGHDWTGGCANSSSPTSNSNSSRYFFSSGENFLLAETLVQSPLGKIVLCQKNVFGQDSVQLALGLPVTVDFQLDDLTETGNYVVFMRVTDVCYPGLFPAEQVRSFFNTL